MYLAFLSDAEGYTVMWADNISAGKKATSYESK